MGRLLEGFQILCTDYDYILERRGDSIQGRTLFKEIQYLNMHVPDDPFRDDFSRDFFFKYSICPLVRGAVWSLQQYTF